MPPASKKLGGHIALGMSVRSSARPSVRHALEFSHISEDMYAKILKFIHALLMKK